MVLQKDGMTIFAKEEPDVVCLQETKCSDKDLPGEIKNVKGYKSYFMSGKYSIDIKIMIESWQSSHFSHTFNSS